MIREVADLSKIAQHRYQSTRAQQVLLAGCPGHCLNGLLVFCDALCSCRCAKQRRLTWSASNEANPSMAEGQHSICSNPLAAGAAVQEAQAAVAAAEETEAVSRAQAVAEMEQLEAKLAAAMAELQLVKTSSSSSSNGLQQVDGAGVCKGDGGFELGSLLVKPAAADDDVEGEESGIMAPCTPCKVFDDGDDDEKNSSSRLGVMTLAVSVAEAIPVAALAAMTATQLQ